MVLPVMDAQFQVMMNNHLGLKCITILFILIIPLATANLSFNFTSFSPNNSNITYEGTAQPVNNTIQLTLLEEPRVAARATYAQPLHLWDGASGNVTDFSTHFSFVTDSSNRTSYGDGFTFFLQPTDSRLFNNATKGSLGLTGLFWNSTEIHLVAVEFDIYKDQYFVDPPYEHVAIDINGVFPSASERWWNREGIMQGRTQEAWISYDSQSTNLSVVFTGFNGSSNTHSLSHVVNLTTLLPEYVTIGFSASTGDGSVAQNIKSWSFRSHPQVIADRPTRPNGNDGVVLGWAVGGPVLLLALAFLVFILWRQRKRTSSEADKIGDEFRNGSICKKFAYDDLKVATNNFAEEHKLGARGFGSVYKGSKVHDQLEG